MNICLNASELAVITGHNPYKEPEEIIAKIWRKHYPADFSACSAKYKAETGVENLVDENAKQTIQRLAPEVADELAKCLKTNTVGDLAKQKKAILAKCDTIAKTPEERKLIRECVQQVTNTTFGIRHENSAIAEYEKLTGETVKIMTRYITKALYNTKTARWSVGGKIDGFVGSGSGSGSDIDAGAIIEVKNRVNCLFYKLRDYEKVQTFTYMYIHNVPKAKLVECLKVKGEININVIDVEYDEEFWKTSIDSKIRAFIKRFDKLMKNEKAKIALIGELFGPHT
jgi:hypothetical protein